MGESDPTVAACRAIMARHAKSFSFAARLLAPDVRDETAVVYAYLRRVDDAIDEATDAERPRALERLRRELDGIYEGGDLPSVPAAFRTIARRRSIPRLYLDELLAGMQMDAEGHRYASDEDLLRYCHRAAGVVGLLMCHVFGVRDDAALVRAAHLGWAMQLTNICRDVAEDWGMGRRYLPADRYRALGVPAPEPSAPPNPPERFPADRLEATRAVVRDLLEEARGLYASGSQGFDALPWRASLAVNAAARLYAAIGDRLAAQRFDPTAGRAYVPTAAKARLALGAIAERLGSGPPAGRIRIPGRTLRFEEAAREWSGRPR